MYTIEIYTTAHSDMVDITNKINTVIQNSNVKEGICVIYVPHTTAAVIINENADPSVKRDILSALNKIIPWNDKYTHMEGNSAAHIKASIIGSDRTILIHDGALALGTWQGIFFCEFDGPRSRKIFVEIMEK